MIGDALPFSSRIDVFDGLDGTATRIFDGVAIDTLRDLAVTPGGDVLASSPELGQVFRRDAATGHHGKNTLPPVPQG